MKQAGDQMKCPKCGRLELKDSESGATCRICGYQLTPGEADKFRLYKLLREESRKK